MAAAGQRGGRFWIWILVPGYDGGPAVGRVAGGSTGPQEFPSLLIGAGLCCSGGVRNGLDALPGGGDLFRPGPGGGDFQGSAAPAADEPGAGVPQRYDRR
jgi:hypothetical protein